MITTNTVYDNLGNWKSGAIEYDNKKFTALDSVTFYRILADANNWVEKNKAYLERMKKFTAGYMIEEG